MLSASIMVLEEGFSPNHCNALSSNWASNHLGFVFTGRHEGGNIYFLTTNIGAILQHRCWANSPRSLLCCTGGLFKSVSEGLSHLQRSFIFWSPNLRFLSCTVQVSTQRQWMPRLYYCFEWRWLAEGTGIICLCLPPANDLGRSRSGASSLFAAAPFICAV